MRTFLIAAAAGVLGTAAFAATPAEAQWRSGYYDRGYGNHYGYDRGRRYGRNEYRQELRECRRELRRADSRREYRRELRECRRELARASRGYRDYDPRWGHRNWRNRYWDGYRWRYRD